MKRLNSALCILYTENTVRVWPDESGVTLVVQRDIPAQHKEKPRSFLRNYGVNLVAWGRIELPTRGFSIRCSTN